MRRASVKRRINQIQFKAAINVLKSQLYCRLPSISEKNEQLKIFFENFSFEAGALSKDHPSYQLLADEFARLEDFDFAASPNQFPQVAGLNAAPDEAGWPFGTGDLDASRSAGKRRIVDHVPSTFPASRQQAMVNFRGKIIAENFKATRQVGIHNDAALNVLLKVLDHSISDESFILVDALPPVEAYALFESFCAGLDVSPFNTGYRDI